MPCLPDVIHTIGYEKQSIDSFISRLKACGVVPVIDVRANPISRKPGFSKRILGERLAAAKVAYRHSPRLGIPSDLRRTIADRAELLDLYERTFLPNATNEIEMILCAARPALLCFEANPYVCHRSRIARCLDERYGLSVNHIRFD